MHTLNLKVPSLWKSTILIKFWFTTQKLLRTFLTQFVSSVDSSDCVFSSAFLSKCDQIQHPTSFVKVIHLFLITLTSPPYPPFIKTSMFTSTILFIYFQISGFAQKCFQSHVWLLMNAFGSSILRAKANQLNEHPCQQDLIKVWSPITNWINNLWTWCGV